MSSLVLLLVVMSIAIVATAVLALGTLRAQLFPLTTVAARRVVRMVAVAWVLLLRAEQPCVADAAGPGGEPADPAPPLVVRAVPLPARRRPRQRARCMAAPPSLTVTRPVLLPAPRQGRGMRPGLVVGLGTLALLGPPQIAPPHGLDAAPPLASNVVIDVNRTEPSLAINPRDPLNIVAASNSNYASNAAHRYPPAAFSSFDGGRTWRGAALTMPALYGTGADTSVAFDGSGVAYLGMVGETYDTFCGMAAHTAAILVARSTDGGRTFGPPVVVDANTGGENDDKPYLTAWEVPATPRRAAHAAVAVVWTRSARTGGSRIMIARSQDGGRTFTLARAVYASPGANLGALPAAGPRGELYVTWEHFTKRSTLRPDHMRIEVARSPDGGATFGRPVPLALSWDLPPMLPNGQLRVFAMPALAVDRENGTAYVTWARARLAASGASAGYAGMAADVVLSRSTDHGATWSAPVVLNDTRAGDRFMPSLAALPGGVVAAIFYDRRVDGRAFDVYLAGVRDRGPRLALYANRRLTRRSSPVTALFYIRPGSSCVAPGRFLGDYITVSADAATATFAAAWADAQPGAPWSLALRDSRLRVASVLAGAPRLVPVVSGATP